MNSVSYETKKNADAEKSAYDPKFDLATRFQEAFVFFNEKLFDNKLPAVVITIQRKRGAAGFFSPDSFAHRLFHEDGKSKVPDFTVHEIAIMPDAMIDRSDREVLSTLVHEMCHLRQQEQGTPSRNGYHNKEWAMFMREVGLEPSTEGKFDKRNPELSVKEYHDAIEGRPTGQKVSHWIVPGHRFDAACAELLNGGFKLLLHKFPLVSIPAPKSKLKYTCPKCGLNAWAKPETKLQCGNCHVFLDCQEVDDEI